MVVSLALAGVVSPDQTEHPAVQTVAGHHVVPGPQALQHCVGRRHPRAEEEAGGGVLQPGQDCLQVTPGGVPVPTIHWLTGLLLS